jgi:O-acetyl-ADP-ribose deacetylase (regulator of RNase III)
VTQEERRKYLIRYLLDERSDTKGCEIPPEEAKQRAMLRGLMNIRKASPISEEFLRIQDEYLSGELEAKGITDSSLLPEIRKGIVLWQGDITLLRCDAIVNAANSRMTGCYAPNHRCIDNCIHSYAGVQLRAECDRVIRAQGIPEAPGGAKITPAYNLPSKYVIHTVGPIVGDRVTEKDERTLSSCYTECLRLASLKGLGSIAFCSISTGMFCYPPREAAEVAVRTVEDYMKTETTIKRVIFNVFSDKAREIYREILSR